MKILVADDDPINRKYLGALLAPEGYTVVECEDGLTTLAYLEQHPCDEEWQKREPRGEPLDALCA
jgi:CheY-like chemotaxis protein